MKIKLVREVFTEKSTEGTLYIDGVKECYVLEDKDRKLEASVCPTKVYGETCIPRGNYQVIIDYSQHFKKEMPHLLNVPCFEGIRIHVGNRPEDTEGCLLLGAYEGSDIIYNSKVTFDAFLAKLVAGLTQGEVWLEVV
jgi:hypothetical protein